jgi:hypothetical protein
VTNAFTIPKESVFAKSAAQDRKIAGSRKGGVIRAASMDVITATYLKRYEYARQQKAKEALQAQTHLAGPGGVRDGADHPHHQA